MAQATTPASAGLLTTTDSFFSSFKKDDGELDKIFNSFKEFEQTEEELRLNEISTDIFNTYMWVICAIGIPANITIIITIVGMRVLSPATFFVTLLAGYDGMALISKLIGHILIRNEIEQGTVLCKLEFFPSYFSTLANWALILICFERFISVCFPLKKVYLLTKRRCYIAAAVVSVALLLIFTGFFALMREPAGDHNCGTPSKYTKFWAHGWYWISVSLYLFLPFLVITGLTIAIVRSLSQARKHRRSLMRKGSEGGPTSAADQRLLKTTEKTERMITIMLIIASVVFLILSLPACIYFLGHDRDTKGVEEARWNLFSQVAYLMTDSSHAVNFFLYFFTAKRFRSFAFRLFCKKCLPRRVFETSEEKVPSQSTKVSTISHHVDNKI